MTYKRSIITIILICIVSPQLFRIAGVLMYADFLFAFTSAGVVLLDEGEYHKLIIPAVAAKILTDLALSYVAGMESIAFIVSIIILISLKRILNSDNLITRMIAVVLTSVLYALFIGILSIVFLATISIYDIARYTLISTILNSISAMIFMPYVSKYALENKGKRYFR